MYREWTKGRDALPRDPGGGRGDGACEGVSPDGDFLCTNDTDHPMPHRAKIDEQTGEFVAEWDEDRSTDDSA